MYGQQNISIPVKTTTKRTYVPDTRLSPLITPITIAIHLFIINGALYLFTPATYLNLAAIIYYNVSWLLIAVTLGFYNIDRTEKFSHNLSVFFELCFIFALAYFAFFTFTNIEVYIRRQCLILAFIFSALTLFRWLFYQFRSYYRIKGGNFANVVVVGGDQNLKGLRKFFEQPELGYRYKGYFNNEKEDGSTYLGRIEDCYDYVLKNKIDEIYCIASRLSKAELQNLLDFADNNLKKLKIIPDNKGVFTRTMNVELCGTVPVLNLSTAYSRFWKRVFDVIFSSLVIVFVLSWLTPLLFVLIKLDSKGPLFFKQLRNGYMKRPFYCYKFRSMEVNGQADTKMSTKNDSRITRIGQIMRKTNIDELPQFFNVFFGHMTVVGPRPHMETHTRMYETSVNKYLVRHFSKPGITGLAQIKGYRGEIQEKSDIVNRVRFDIFYLERLSFFLDLKIIYCTIINAIKGEKMAY